MRRPCKYSKLYCKYCKNLVVSLCGRFVDSFVNLRLNKIIVQLQVQVLFTTISMFMVFTENTTDSEKKDDKGKH